MQTIDSIQSLREVVRSVHQKGKTVGFVATMGYLHEGHLQLVQEARRQNDFVVVSVFVNPLQFGPNEDLESYPRDLARDSQLLENGGCDVLFAPSVEEMYPRKMATQVAVPELSTVLCGKSRPIHFQGVATVVCKLLNIVQPDVAYFGQKDAQQVTVIRRMVADLSIPVQIVAVPIVREESGLAKSSRNIYLTETDRTHATVLSRALQKAVQSIESGERDGRKVAQALTAEISGEPGVKLDYAEVVDAETLHPLSVLDGKVLMAVAAFVGKARLIDNVPLEICGATVTRR